ncbi:hypothetical protein [Flavobacterium sp.]|uniref:hypothetical protein n=1 Tax=Flavobacterium sp. TaxID=239 RepID=UPI0037539F20
MVKITSNDSSSPKTNKIAIIVGILVLGAFVFLKMNNLLNKNSTSDISESSSSIESILSKDYNLRTFEEWKQIADYRAQEYYECMKDSNLSNTYKNESCSISYNNNWVDFRDSLEEKANLSYEQQQALEDYWHKTRGAVTEKVIALMEENDKKKRPEYYKNN